MTALVGMACVFGCPQPPPDDDTRIASIQIVPQIVTALKGTRFQIRLRAWNANHHLLPDSKAALVTWTTGPGLTFHGSDKGASVIVDALDNGTFPLTTELKAALGSVGDAVAITVIAPGPLGTTDDWIVGDHTPSEPPLIVLADGRASEGSTKVWRGDTTIAVVGEGPLDQFRRDCNVANCGEVTMFSRQFALTSRVAQWTDVCDLVAFTDATVPTTCPSLVVSPPSPPVGVAVRTYIAASGGGIESSVGAELAKAREILADSRSGLEVNAAPEVVFPITLVLDVTGPDWKCPMSGPNDVRQQLRTANISDTTFKPSGVTLVYVDQLLEPATLGPASSAPYRGYACPWDPTNGTIVLVSRLDRVSSTLSHELGHGLSGWGPTHNFGHTDGPDFDESNIMWPWHADNVPASRVNFSLGQVYRLSLETGSILNRSVSGSAPNSGVDCRLVIGTPPPCPRLAKDVRPP